MRVRARLRNAGADPAKVDAFRDALATWGVEVANATDRGVAFELAAVAGADDERLVPLLGGRQGALLLAVAFCPLSASNLFKLLDTGAVDVVQEVDPRRAAERIAARLHRLRAVDALLASEMVSQHAVGASPAWCALLRAVVEVAAFTQASVLITGETGTGKEQLARVVHALDARPQKGELVVVDCTTLTPELAGSELFGHERGAFTGAVSARDGAFALAHGGTLFLDEVGELPLALQAQLLRVVQEQQYKRVGGNAWQRSAFRLLSATNRDLEEEVRAGRFRSDLYFRIAGFTCRTPPLRERREDILLLSAHFLRQLAPGLDGELDAAVREYLLTRDYPGNVRDLRQTVARICMRHAGPGPLTVGDIPPSERGSRTSEAWPDAAFRSAVSQAVELGVGLREIGQAAAEVAVQIALAKEGGSLPKAAARLGVTPRALQMRAVAQRE